MSNYKKEQIVDRPIWLTSLAEADHETVAPDELEAKLQSAFRRRRSATLIKRMGSIGLAATVAIVLWIVPKSAMVPLAPDDPSDDGLADVIADASNFQTDDEWAADDFVPTKLASEQPLESVHVIRVSMPGAALAHYGVSAEVLSATEVTADLLVGQDGIARAIRVVKQQQRN